jgi:hypothetical protein
MAVQPFAVPDIATGPKRPAADVEFVPPEQKRPRLRRASFGLHRLSATAAGPNASYDFRRVVRRAAPLTRLPFLPTTKDRFSSIPNELPVP